MSMTDKCVTRGRYITDQFATRGQSITDQCVLADHLAFHLELAGHDLLQGKPFCCTLQYTQQNITHLKLFKSLHNNARYRAHLCQHTHCAQENVDTSKTQSQTIHHRDNKMLSFGMQYQSMHSQNLTEKTGLLLASFSQCMHVTVFTSAAHLSPSILNLTIFVSSTQGFSNFFSSIKL